MARKLAIAVIVPTLIEMAPINTCNARLALVISRAVNVKGTESASDIAAMPRIEPAPNKMI